ncbi:extracellular solute-binding protein [Chlamydiota bacterium]
MKKNTLFLIFVILLVLLPQYLFSEKDKPLSIWAMGDEGIRIREIIPLFLKENPSISIDLQIIPWGAANEKITTAIVGNLPPDLCQMGTTWMPEFSAMNAFCDLSSFEKKSSIVKKDNFFKGAWESCLYKNKLYGIPWYVDTRALFYRKDLLKKAGFNAPPKTWDELVMVGIRLKELEIDVDGDNTITNKDAHFPIDLPVYDKGALLLSSFIWQNGGRVLTKDCKNSVILDDKTKDALWFYITLFKKQIAGVRASTAIRIEQAFASGYYTMFVSGPWTIYNLNKYAPEIAGLWDVGLLPGKESQASFIGGCNWVIFNQSQQKENAWKFIEFMSRPEIQVKWYQINKNLPSCLTAWDNPLFKDLHLVQRFKEQLEQARPTPMIENWDEVADKVSGAMEEFIFLTEKKELSEIKTIFNTGLKKLDTTINNLLHKSAPQQNSVFKISLFIILFLGIVGCLFYFIFRPEKKDEFNEAMKASLLKTSSWNIVLMLGPALVILAVFLFLPVIFSFIMSLTNWDVKGITDLNFISFIGFSNYIQLFKDPIFWRALLNTSIFAFIGVPLTITIALLLAVLLNQGIVKLSAFFRIGMFLPVITTMVACAVVWKWLYNPRYGIINWLLSFISVPGQDWLQNPNIALISLIIMAAWKNFGFNLVIFLAGLQGIPEYLYEAADIDGASRLQKFWYITVPLLKPVTVFVSIMATIGYFQFFAEPYVMTQGGPKNSTISVVLYMYKQGFNFFNLGYSTAIAYVLTTIIIIFSISQLKFSNATQQHFN